MSRLQKAKLVTVASSPPTHSVTLVSCLSFPLSFHWYLPFGATEAEFFAVHYCAMAFSAILVNFMACSPLSCQVEPLKVIHNLTQSMALAAVVINLASSVFDLSSDNAI